MNVSALLAEEPPVAEDGLKLRKTTRTSHAYHVESSNSFDTATAERGYATHSAPRSSRRVSRQESSQTHDLDYAQYHPKTINFQLLLSTAGQHRARLPLRIRLGYQDGSDKIVETVKSFYGLYEGQGVSFEDDTGRSVIADYDSLPNNATIFVRILVQHPDFPLNKAAIGCAPAGGSPRKPRLDEPFQMLPPLPYTRPNSRTAGKRASSPPSGRLRRDGSVRVPPLLKTRRSSLGDGENMEIGNCPSDSDAGSVSVSSSRRAKSDHLASAEISVDNIVEGGRRKRAKFESSVSRHASTVANVEGG